MRLKNDNKIENYAKNGVTTIAFGLPCGFISVKDNKKDLEGVTVVFRVWDISASIPAPLILSNMLLQIGPMCSHIDFKIGGHV